MKSILAILLVLAFALPVAAQSTRPVTMAWDPMPIDQSWTEVRIYSLAASVYTQVAKTFCVPGPPISCPTTIMIQLDKTKAFTVVARSFDGSQESDDSNQVVIPAQPKPPVNLKRQ